ncbi:hypothetical protein FQA47_003060 [Oryzias melastigma]|uniref:Uncharacterized protein n=1 Tax=Oryzias melastigma TaxID=30732 RepID=A0A834CN88_ORYME|nr:hypothetical protein FQA47_003060 [Oryzias melastigma]
MELKYQHSAAGGAGALDLTEFAVICAEEDGGRSSPFSPLGFRKVSPWLPLCSAVSLPQHARSALRRVPVPNVPRC